jgi:hypothetical protein
MYRQRRVDEECPRCSVLGTFEELSGPTPWYPHGSMIHRDEMERARRNYQERREYALRACMPMLRIAEALMRMTYVVKERSDGR